MTQLTPEEIKAYTIRWLGYQSDTDDIALVVAKIAAFNPK